MYSNLYTYFNANRKMEISHALSGDRMASSRLFDRSPAEVIKSSERRCSALFVASHGMEWLAV
jgi:hypothetical protein